jgi:hypothetical protein
MDQPRDNIYFFLRMGQYLLNFYHKPYGGDQTTESTILVKKAFKIGSSHMP